MLAHIAGMPVEEVALSLAPAAAAICGFIALRLRHIGHKPNRRRRAHTLGTRPR